MRCPECGSPCRVVQTKQQQDSEGDSEIKRLRICTQRHYFFTLECYDYVDLEEKAQKNLRLECATSL